MSSTKMSFTSSRSTTRRAFTTLAVSASLLFAGLAAGVASAGEIIPANMDAYKQAATAKKPIIMHIHATWCPVCAKQNPIIEELMKEPEFKDVIVFKIDFDADKALVGQLGVKYQSTLIAAKGPLEIDRTAGITDKEQIRQFIRKSI
jgi:thioredoxin 1